MRPTAILVGSSLVFLAAFAWQRSRSGFLAVEARVDEARAIAAASGLELAEVMALHELLGAGLERVAWGERARRLAALAAELGHVELGVLALCGQRSLAEQLRDVAGGDAERVPELVQQSRAAVETAGRFRAVAERFRSRLPR